MVFSSPIFLFGFLPLVLLFYYLSPKIIKNLTLLFFSLIFYAWGEVFYVGVIILSIFSNYCIGVMLSKKPTTTQRRKIILFVGLSINIFLLVSFKYAGFITDNINTILILLNTSTIVLKPIHLPLGISFFTFQAISYIIDVYKKKVDYQDNIFNLALYISLFPQLIAGPIVRYHDVSNQIFFRNHSIELFAGGVQRFICGLAKKVLIANPLGEVADSTFSLSGNELTFPLSWIGILAYTLQIYFDFSGYSDMAIGLGKMFGLNFLENFNYPYISTSVREFWRRWHISLSTWFRDYLYIPLGGNRVSTAKIYRNLLLVFILTGFWHGASWNFLIWGLFHGFFIAIEHAGFSDVLKSFWKPFKHFYLLLVVITGWVFFRSDSLIQSILYLKSMADISNFHTTIFQYASVLSHESFYALIIGAILSVPLKNHLLKFTEILFHNKSNGLSIIYTTPKLIFLFSLLFLSVLKISSSTYNPFIYFRF